MQVLGYKGKVLGCKGQVWGCRVKEMVSKGKVLDYMLCEKESREEVLGSGL